MSLIDKIITWYSAHMNYASITALMAVESSFIPFPSEVVIPPAAFVAGQPESVLCATGNYTVDVLLIVLFGTLGAMIGAIINYALSVWLGRLIIYKFADSRLGHLCLLSGEKLERAEAYRRFPVVDVLRRIHLELCTGCHRIYRGRSDESDQGVQPRTEHRSYRSVRCGYSIHCYQANHQAQAR